MDGWLSLTILKEDKPSARPKPLFLISVPKKIVKQAVRRNRIKRVLREALRGAAFLSEKKTFRFKVAKAPQSVSLAMAQSAIKELIRDV